jgi:hypothetical protein
MKRLKVNLFLFVVGAVLLALLLAPEVAEAAAWSVVASPSPGSVNDLNGVAIVSANDIWAVGDFVDPNTGTTTTVIEQWNGTAWSVVTSPNSSASENILDAATADQSSGQAWAVGEFFNTTNNVLETLTEFNA